MAEENKDVVAARINLDTSKIAASFKNIDTGVKQNTESFKLLNEQLASTAKSYESMASVADKLALSADERRKKILAESEALVNQRNAQANYYNAKASTIDQSNNLIKAKMDLQYKLIQQADQRIELEAERHAARMANLQQSAADPSMQRGSFRSALSGSGGPSIGNIALSIGLYNSLTGAYETMLNGMKDVENGAAGLHQVFGTQVDDQGQLNKVTNDFVSIAQKYGESINEVLTVAKQWGRQYKDIQTAMTLTNSSTLLSVVDNVNLANSNKALEATMNSMGMAATSQASAFANSMKIVDSWSALAHKASVSATDLMEATQNSGGAAKQAGVDFDQLQALATSAIRNTGMTGANIGNMLKSLFASIQSDKSEKALKSLDISLKQVGANGQQEFRPVFDVLLELSQKLQTTDKNQQKLIETISGGKFQWSKVASMLSDYNTIIDAYAVSLNSAGAAQQYAQEQMNTLGRDITRLKDSFVQLAAQTDQNGLGSFLKSIVNGLDNLLIGLEQMPPAAGKTLLVISGLLVALKAMNGVMATLEPLSRLMITAYTRMAATSAIATEATVAETAATEGLTAAFTTLDIVSGGLMLAIGAVVTGITMYSIAQGKATEATRASNEAKKEQVGLALQDYNLAKQKVDFMDTAISQEQQLKKAMEDTTLSADKRNKLMQDMVDLYHAVGKATGDDALTQVNASNVKNVSLASEQKSVSDLVTAKKTAYENAVKINNAAIQNDLDTTNQQIDDVNKRIEAIKNETQAKLSQLTFSEKLNVGFTDYAKKIDQIFGNKQGVADDNAKLNSINQTAKDRALKSAQAEFDNLKLKQAQDEYDLASAKLDLANIGGTGNGSPTGVPDPSASGNAFKFPLNGIDLEVKQAEKSVNDASNAIDIFNAKVFTMTDAQQKTVDLTSLYEAHQKSLADVNIKLRGTLDELSGKQNELNGLLAAGKITNDEYDQASSEVQSRIDSVTQEVNKNSTAWWNDQKSMKDATDQMLKDSYDFSSKWIAHQKAIGQLDMQQELDAWQRVQTRYQEGTQERMQADEQVYAAKQALIQKEQTAADDMLAKEKDRINQAKQAFDNAQDAKIKAIDAQIQAQDQANSDADYQTKLQEKEARAKVLESGVGSQAKEELKQTLQDIADMKQQHDRELAKRDLESKKQSLQDQKDAQDKTYDALLQSFDTYKNSAYQIEDAIKQFRINSNDEANTQILNQLDAFIESYKSKMAQLSPIANATTQQDISKIYAPGDMAGAAAIGAIAGLPTSAKFPFPTVSMPSIDYSKPQTNVTNVYQFDNSIGSIALAGLGAAAGLMDQRTGLIQRQQSLGSKVR